MSRVGAQYCVRDIFICRQSPPAYREGDGVALLLLCPGQHLLLPTSVFLRALFPGLESTVSIVHVASQAACLRLCSQMRGQG